jgi:hypothetical protein
MRRQWGQRRRHREAEAIAKAKFDLQVDLLIANMRNGGRRQDCPYFQPESKGACHEQERRDQRDDNNHS